MQPIAIGRKSLSRKNRGLHSAVLAGDPTDPPRVFELLLDPLVERLTFKWTRRPRRDLEEQAIDAILSYLERPERYDPKRASLLSYLTMDAHGDLLNAYQRATSGRETLMADVEDPAGRRNEVIDVYGPSTDDRRVLARLREADHVPDAVREGVGGSARGDRTRRV